MDPVGILVLEDDVELLHTLSEVLSDLGHRVEATSSSQRAVELSLEYDFQVVITDIRMAGMDGLDALARVQEWTPEVRSLVITGFSSEVDTLRALRLGVSEYLLKPFTIQQLSESVGRLVEQVRNQRILQEQERSLRRFLIWSLQNWAQSVPVPGVHETAQVAHQLALRLHLEPGGAESVQLATLYQLLGEHGLPDELSRILPRRVLAIVQSGEGMEHQILEAARCLAQGQRLPESLPPALRQAALLQEPQAHPAPARQRRSALALALTLEQGDQLGPAVQAYQSLLALPPSREGVMASLALGRMARRLGRQDQLQQYALQAVEIGRQLGPLSLASTSYEGGILMGESDRPAALQLLQRAQELWLKLEFVGQAALARLACDWVGQKPLDPEALSNVCRFPSEELTSAGNWLVPLLLEHPEPATERVAALILRDRPGVIHQLVVGHRLSEPALRQLFHYQPAAQTLRLLAQDSHLEVRTRALHMLESGGQPEAPPALRIFSLGVQEIFHGADRLGDDAFRKNQKARHMLTYLALERGRVVSDDALAEIFWPDEGGRGRKNVYAIRTILRKALQPTDCAQEVAYVCRMSQGLGMNSELNWWHDVEELRQCLRRWEQAERQNQSSVALAALQRAAQLYRGPFLENCYLDWAITLRQQLEFHMTQALTRLAERLLDDPAGQPEALTLSEVLEVCQRALDIDVCCESAYALSMRSHLQAGRAQEALKVFDRCQRVLRRELQSDPSIALLELQMRARMAL
jgi:two-component SAPR family response regulator